MKGEGAYKARRFTAELLTTEKSLVIHLKGAGDWGIGGGVGGAHQGLILLLML